jgi:hypothetical protein
MKFTYERFFDRFVSLKNAAWLETSVDLLSAMQFWTMVQRYVAWRGTILLTGLLH